MQARLELLRTYRAPLDELRRLPPDVYVEEEAFAGRYLIQAAAQICIDIANHVIAFQGWRAPRDFRDSFVVLREQGVLDKGFDDPAGGAGRPAQPPRPLVRRCR
ncbi:MAG: DUF86 domain-containing protein [Egibacteraceae bacterium]